MLCLMEAPHCHTTAAGAGEGAAAAGAAAPVAMNQQQRQLSAGYYMLEGCISTMWQWALWAQPQFLASIRGSWQCRHACFPAASILLCVAAR